MDRIHCICTRDLDTGLSQTFRSDRGEIENAVLMLQAADELVGHNIIDFDLNAIRLIHPWFKPRGKITDTIVIARLIWADIKDIDFARIKANPAYMPGNLVGRQGLEAWGHRLGFHKGDYSKEMKERGLDPWAETNDEMVAYCENDVALTCRLLEVIANKNYSARAVQIEHDVWTYCLTQTSFGVSFDEAAAVLLYAELLQERASIERELIDVFGCWWTPKLKDVEKPATRSMRRFIPHEEGGVEKLHKLRGIETGYYEFVVADAVFVPLTLVEFNPSSRDHAVLCLKRRYGWQPRKFGDDGKPTLDEDVLSELKYPEAKLLSRYLLIDKRIGQIAEGKEAWLKQVRNGRIHGRVNTNAAITGRATHSGPNLAQVPKVGSPWGAECRALFRATPGWTFVGADASGLELRCLAHYMALWDGGAYGRAVVDGKSEDGTDVHSLNCRAIGLDPKVLYVLAGKQSKGRDVAKTFIYAYLYGAGDLKIGSIVGKGKKQGSLLRKNFETQTPALGKLSEEVKKRAKSGYLIGLDGRHLKVRSEHSALNTLLQGAGAVIMKQAMVNWHHMMEAQGFRHGVDYRQLLWIHDEFQAECRTPEIAAVCGQTMVDAIRKVTSDFNLRCPLDGEFKAGANWAETH